MLTSPVWRLLLSQRLRVERETPKRSWTSFLGMPRSTAESTFNLRSFEYAFMDTIFMQVHYLRKPLSKPQNQCQSWIPAFAGMTGEVAEMTDGAGMTVMEKLKC